VAFVKKKRSVQYQWSGMLNLKRSVGMQSWTQETRTQDRDVLRRRLRLNPLPPPHQTASARRFQDDALMPLRADSGVPGRLDTVRPRGSVLPARASHTEHDAWVPRRPDGTTRPDLRPRHKLFRMDSQAAQGPRDLLCTEPVSLRRRVGTYAS
jgi:hypothetical protein